MIIEEQRERCEKQENKIGLMIEKRLKALTTIF